MERRREQDAVGPTLGPRHSEDQAHQRAVLRVLFGIAIPAGATFGAINIARDNTLLGVVEFLFSIAAIVFWRQIPHSQHVRLIVGLFAIPMIVLVCYTMYVPYASPTMFAWLFAIPVLVYTALGERHGLLITAVFYLVVGGQFAYRFGHDPVFQDPVAVMNISVCAIGVWCFVHAYEKARNEAHQRLSVVAVTDPLTGVYNRLGLESIFERSRSVCEAEGLTMGLIMIDLDHFKSINDTYGHDCGDLVLQKVAEALQRAVRSDDQVFRMGGEEFCLVVPRIGEEQMVRTAEALRARIENLQISFEGKRINVTTSVGAVLMESDLEGLDAMLSEADRRLYKAKNSGRNRVVSEMQAAAA